MSSETAQNLGSESINGVEAGIGLLRLIDLDPVRAEVEFRQISAMLERYFASRRCADPANLAGETILRVYQALLKNKEITCQLRTYFIAVANNVANEEFRDRSKAKAITEDMVQSVGQPDPTLDFEIWGQDLYQNCLHLCLEKLIDEERHLLISYYSGGNNEGDQKRNRQEMRKELGITIRALRARALRLRERVSGCIRACVDRKSTE